MSRAGGGSAGHQDETIGGSHVPAHLHDEGRGSRDGRPVRADPASQGVHQGASGGSVGERAPVHGQHVEAVSGRDCDGDHRRHAAHAHHEGRPGRWRRRGRAEWSGSVGGFGTSRQSVCSVFGRVLTFNIAHMISTEAHVRARVILLRICRKMIGNRVIARTECSTQLRLSIMMIGPYQCGCTCGCCCEIPLTFVCLKHYSMRINGGAGPWPQTIHPHAMSRHSGESHHAKQEMRTLGLDRSNP
mmetsp:Transcript_126/g.313  ORF Transcript_126/g.313 Transcript_126/m.313 type:complete len:244 (-) Transcript_126:219-950(-)